MPRQPDNEADIPDQTAEVARVAFPKGNSYLSLRDEFEARSQAEHCPSLTGCGATG